MRERDAKGGNKFLIDNILTLFDVLNPGRSYLSPQLQPQILRALSVREGQMQMHGERGQTEIPGGRKHTFLSHFVSLYPNEIRSDSACTNY